MPSTQPIQRRFFSRRSGPPRVLGGDTSKALRLFSFTSREGKGERTLVRRAQGCGLVASVQRLAAAVLSIDYPIY